MGVCVWFLGGWGGGDMREGIAERGPGFWILEGDERGERRGRMEHLVCLGGAGGRGYIG